MDRAVEEEASWEFAPGRALGEGLIAWAALGSGRHFESWLAWSTAHWLPVVVKLPRPSRLHDELTLVELRREADMASTLAHPGIQRLLDRRLDHVPPYLVFEYIEGPTLEMLLDEHGVIPPRDAILFGLQLAGTLGYLHGRGVAHLDVKPGNVAVRDGRPVLLDLGIVRPLGTIAGRRETRGSPPYMAPEQCRREAITPAMDVFGLGATLFDLLAGDPPFEPERTEEGWSRPQLDTAAPALATKAVDAPAELAALVDAMLRLPARRRPHLPTIVGRLQRILRTTYGEALWPSWVNRHRRQLGTAAAVGPDGAAAGARSAAVNP